jgi:hypothetical protein
MSPAQNFYLFTGPDLQPIYAHGTDEEAQQYLVKLNNWRTFYHYRVEELSQDAVEKAGLFERRDVVVLNDEFKLLDRRITNGAIVIGKTALCSDCYEPLFRCKCA